MAIFRWINIQWSMFCPNHRYQQRAYKDNFDHSRVNTLYCILFFKLDLPLSLLLSNWLIKNWHGKNNLLLSTSYSFCVKYYVMKIINGDIFSLKKNELPQFVWELLKSLRYSEDLWNLTGIPIHLSNLCDRVEWICLDTSESRNVRVQRPACDNISLFVFHWLQWGKSSILHLLWFQSKRRAPDTILVLWKRELESYFN